MRPKTNADLTAPDIRDIERFWRYVEEMTPLYLLGGQAAIWDLIPKRGVGPSAPDGFSDACAAYWHIIDKYTR